MIRAFQKSVLYTSGFTARQSQTIRRALHMLCSPLRSMIARKAGLFTVVRRQIGTSIQTWIKVRIRIAVRVRVRAQTLPGALTRFNSHSYPNWRLIVAACVILAAQACSREGLDPELETYTNRLADILDTEHHPTAQPPVSIDRRCLLYTSDAADE